MAMIAVAASKAADLIEERDGYAPSPWRSVPWLHQRSCYDGSAQGTEVLVSMATTAVAASKERLARIVKPRKALRVHGDHCRGCIKGRACRITPLRRSRCPWR